MSNKIITFCKAKCCPVVEITEDKILLGDSEGEEGVTTWSKQQFKDFVDAVKDGKFDEITND